MKSLLELIPYLNVYPVWVRLVVLSLPPLYALLLLFLFILAPSPVVAIESFRRLVTQQQNLIALDITVRNATSTLANVTGAELELYGGEKPQGGLLSALAASATYTVEKTDAGVLVHSDQDKFPQQAKTVRPYANNSYTRMTLPLAQQVKAGEVDRFILLVRPSEVATPDHDTVELKLDYNGDKVTAPSILKLK